MLVSPDTSSAVEQAVGAVSAQFSGPTMTSGGYYLFVSNVACWVAQSANPIASAGTGSLYVPANTPIVLDGRCGAKLAVIEDSAGGKASLVRVLIF